MLPIYCPRGPRMTTRRSTCSTIPSKLHEKSLAALEKLLSARFARVYHSSIADLTRARGLRTANGRPFLVLDDDRLASVGRSYRTAVRQRQATLRTPRKRYAPLKTSCR
jgi:hypothetical protein